MGNREGGAGKDKDEEEEKEKEKEKKKTSKRVILPCTVPCSVRQVS